jgi:hypothetical protein
LQVSDVNGVVERLLVFLESSYSHIVAETLVQLKDLLRRYPDLGQVGPCRGQGEGEGGRADMRQSPMFPAAYGGLK